MELQGGITNGPPGISLQGALDVAFLGARRNEETIARSSGVEKPWRHRNGLYFRRTLIVVSTFYSKINTGLYKCKSNFSEFQYSVLRINVFMPIFCPTGGRRYRRPSSKERHHRSRHSVTDSDNESSHCRAGDDNGRHRWRNRGRNPRNSRSPSLQNCYKQTPNP